jgi:hypothetical protein
MIKFWCGKYCFKVWAKAYEGKEVYKEESEMSESIEDSIFAEGAQQGLIELMDFIQDELNDFECPFRSGK